MIHYNIDVFQKYILQNKITQNSMMKSAFEELNENNQKKTRKKKKENDKDIIINIINKTTDDTYKEMKKQLYEHLKQMKWDDETIKLIPIIFSIFGKNKFYSKLFANFYKEIHHFHKSFDTFMYETIDKTFEIIDEMKFNENNYDDWCEELKIIENEKSLCMFYINLYLCKVLDETTITNIIIKLRNKIEFSKEKENVNYEILDTIYLMYKECDKKIDNKIIIELKDLKKQPGIQMKALFKIMDIFEI